MKILFISPSFFPATVYGGPIFSSLAMCRELNRVGVDIEVHTTNVNRTDRLPVEIGASTELDVLKGVPVFYHRENITDRISFGLLRAIIWKSRAFDLLFVQGVFSISTPVSVVSSFLQSKPVIVSVRGSLAKWCMGKRNGPKRAWLLFLKLFSSSIYWHVTSDDERQDIIRVFGTGVKPRILQIPNGVYMEHHNVLSRENFLTQYELDKDHIYILSSGRVHKKKGYDFTIRALPFLDANIRLVIIGEDYGEQQILEELSISLGVQDRVIFCGHVDPSLIWSFYAHCELFVLNSRHENFGNVYLEALSSGKQIIASKETPWMCVENTIAGAWIPNDPKEIAKAVEQLLLLRQDGPIRVYEKCRAVAAQFTWQAQGDKMYGHIREILNHN